MVQSLPSLTRSSTPRKRQRDSDSDTDDDTRSGITVIKRGRGSRKVAAAYQSSRQTPDLGCPFFIASPQSFHHSSTCASRGWQTISRVKEHLQRCHYTPGCGFSCDRCLENFPSEDELFRHQRRAEACPRVEIQSRDLVKQSISEPAMTKLKSRSKRRRGQSCDADASEKWYEIWRILFPGTPLPKSPYFTEPASSAVEKFVCFLKQWLVKPEGIPSSQLTEEARNLMVANLDAAAEQYLCSPCGKTSSESLPKQGKHPKATNNDSTLPCLSTKSSSLPLQPEPLHNVTLPPSPPWPTFPDLPTFSSEPSINQDRFPMDETWCFSGYENSYQDETVAWGGS
ncbi:hypothetical protein BX600DRAFT_504509 [Xylariales sp. PMI_506]|nr:hypothetical protein BX600DRAFT_504509 [Xylariales sp. PMI_506]